jgi:hypothetical protein
MNKYLGATKYPATPAMCAAGKCAMVRCWPPGTSSPDITRGNAHSRATWEEIQTCETIIVCDSMTADNYVSLNSVSDLYLSLPLGTPVVPDEYSKFIILYSNSCGSVIRCHVRLLSVQQFTFPSIDLRLQFP